jgi:murein DD-endopeptidase MepM/ murein hydrolase activator NlpD
MGRARLLGAGVVLLGTAGFALSGHWPWRRLPPSAPRPVAIVPDLSIETADTLRRGETLSQLLARQDVADLDVGRIEPRGTLDPRRLRSGLIFRFTRPAPDSQPTRISVRSSPEEQVVFTRNGGSWSGAVETIAWHAEPVRIEGAIDNSLYEAIDAQVSDSQLDAADRVRLAWDLADIYAWQVDFTRDIQSGDRFRVLYERLVSADGEVRFGRILAGDLTMSGKSLTAFRFEGDGRAAFYDADGNSLRRAFLRAPVQFRRISSTFARSRRHPILGITRKHQGTDYAASPGTPVMAAGEGVVLRAGRAGGYGNLHLRGYARGVRAGARVSQGQTIGYVGSTGLASGPHLHYEFRVNGVAKDSRRIDLGNGSPVPATQRAAFEQTRDSLTAQLGGPSLPLTASAAAAPAPTN